MHNTPSALLAQLQLRVKKLATCWKVERTDGAAIRVTDHNTRLTVEGQHYSPLAAPSSSAVQHQLGLKDRNQEIIGAVQTDLVTNDDLRAGLYRDAKVTEMTVDWSLTNVGVLSKNVFWVSNIRFNEDYWEVQLVGQSQWLKKPVGRVYNRICDADLGDSRCKVDLEALRESGTVGTIQVGRESFSLAGGPESHPAGHWDRGELTWTSGANSGVTCEIETFTTGGPGGSSLTFYLKTPFDFQVGDAYTLVPGCDQLTTTCINKYNNIVNFRGFPTVPGNDTLTYFRNAGS